jgi:hypothetical protein
MHTMFIVQYYICALCFGWICFKSSFWLFDDLTSSHALKAGCLRRVNAVPERERGLKSLSWKIRDYLSFSILMHKLKLERIFAPSILVLTSCLEYIRGYTMYCCWVYNWVIFLKNLLPYTLAGFDLTTHRSRYLHSILCGRRHPGQYIHIELTSCLSQMHVCKRCTVVCSSDSSYCFIFILHSSLLLSHHSLLLLSHLVYHLTTLQKFVKGMKTFFGVFLLRCALAVERLSAHFPHSFLSLAFRSGRRRLVIKMLHTPSGLSIEILIETSLTADIT